MPELPEVESIFVGDFAGAAGGHPIEKIKPAGRGMHFCRRCQK